MLVEKFFAQACDRRTGPYDTYDEAVGAIEAMLTSYYGAQPPLPTDNMGRVEKFYARPTNASPVTTRTRTVMRWHAMRFVGETENGTKIEAPEFATPFATPYGDGDEDRRHTFVTLDADVWADMGRPDTLTVTIEPGDHLND